ncbi:MAG: mevalonate kinase [Nitrososphaerota archaeon]|nr:mevalonate kinase [Candidatus Calditenuaceae archaeon]MDW8073136.1 mevalonate kinase [Nitrososphaerota archaeon]
MAVTYSAPAKVILCGEHYVVYGGKAVACAIPMRAHATVSKRDDELISIESQDAKISATWKGEKLVKSSDQSAPSRLRPIKIMINKISEMFGAKGFSVVIRSQIPRGMGLGSSASVSLAVASACLSAIGVEPKQSELFDIASIAESEIHYRASGVDLAASLTGGFISYIRGERPRPIPVGEKFNLILISTKKGRRTGAIVKQVSTLREQFINVFDKLRSVNDEVAAEMEVALTNLRFERIGALFTIQHNLLKTIGVSNKALDDAVDVALRAGALGAKLTGAGGGGCVIAVAPQNRVKEVAKAVSSKYPVHILTVPHDGLRREK